jgi:hypothetical protein
MAFRDRRRTTWAAARALYAALTAVLGETGIGI